MILYYVFGVMVAFFASLGQIMLKKASLDSRSNNLSIITNAHLLYGVFYFILSALLSIYSMRRIQFSIFFSLTAFNYIFIISLSKMLLKEKLDVYKIAGCIIILFGILIFNIM